MALQPSDDYRDKLDKFDTLQLMELQTLLFRVINESGKFLEEFDYKKCI